MMTIAEALLRNTRQAVRSLARKPAFTLMVVLTLALGIGANSAVFSIVDAVLLKPLPIPQGERLVEVSHYDRSRTRTNIAPVRVGDWSRLSSSFEAISAYYTEDVSDITGQLPERVRRGRIVPGFLEVWGAAPTLGRGFTANDFRFGSTKVVTISDRYWRARFGGASDVVGKTVRMDNESYTVIGVMSAAFKFPEREVDWWVPEYVDAPYAMDRRANWFAGVVGRLKPGVSASQAQADLMLVQSQLGEQYPQTDRELEIRVAPYAETLVSGVSGSLWMLFGAVLVLLLITCTNIGSLLLSRAAQREEEIAVRFWLGASRMAVVMQMLLESAVLAFFGAGLGILVAVALSTALKALAPDLPRADEIGIDARILAYTAICAVVVTLLCGLLPALRGAQASSSGSARGQISSRQRMQWVMVGMQVTLSVALTSGAGLLLRSFDQLSRVNPGFDPGHVLTFRISGSYGEVKDYARVVQRINTTLEELSALPGVHAAATSMSTPGAASVLPGEFSLVEGRADIQPRMIAESRVVSPGYFATLGIPVLAGEVCRQQGTDASSGVMINRSFADRYLAGRTAVGLHLAGNSPQRIVGVVGDARELGMDREPVPTVYTCFSTPNPIPWYFIRTHGDPMGMAAALRAKIKQLEPLRSVYDISSLEALLEAKQSSNKLRMTVLTLFAVSALSLACLGVYATLSYAVSLRRREVGLRMALGARQGHIVSGFMMHAMRVVGLACLAGTVLALASGRFLSGMLYGVSPSDPMTLSMVIALVVAVAGLAALLPALRASRVDPNTALRE